MKEILNHLFEKNTLTREKANEVLTDVANGKYSQPEMASFLTVYMMRKITPQELAGFRDAMFNLSVQIDLSDFNTIDVCGTGGDEKNTFNISTLSAFVLAGAGVKVAKHGNYAASSACGSSNIFEHFGYEFTNDANKLLNHLDKNNLCYMHAQLFHPAMKNIGPVRKALKVRTFFNILGPMINPSKPQNQLVGVYNEEVMNLYSEVYKGSGVNHIILHALDGYDEISLTGDVKYMREGIEKTVSPSDLGFSIVKPEELHGGNTVEEAAKIFLDILEGNGTKAQEDVVLANSTIALKCYYPEKTMEECKAIATKSLESKKALNVLKNLGN